MKRWWIVTSLFAAFFAPVAHAQLGSFQNNCERGGTPVTTQGLQSTNKVQGSWPGCLVTVYQTGTTNLATIYADGVGTPLSNPFTASTVTGNFIFHATFVTNYDVVISGGLPAPGLTPPFTFSNVGPTSGGNSSQPFNVLNYGCVGDFNLTTGTGTDDSVCLQAANTAAQAANACMYLPTGHFFGLNGTITTQCIRGGGSLNSGLVETNTTAGAVVITANPNGTFQGHTGIQGASVYGSGKLSTGTLVEVDNTVNSLFSDVTLGNSGGRGFALLGSTERFEASGIKIDYVRWPIVLGGQADSVIFNGVTDIGYPGAALTSAAQGVQNASTVYCYSVNCTAGVFNTGSSGNPQALYPDPHYAITSIQNGDTVKFDGLSIKPMVYIGGIQAQAGNMYVNSAYFEQANANVSVSDGGNSGAIALTTTAGLGTGTGEVAVASTQWFPGTFGTTANLTAFSSPIVMVAHCVDYLSGSTAASVCGGGITKGQYEYLSIGGCASDLNQCLVTARGQRGTTAVNWPSGVILEMPASSPAVHVANTHFFGNNNPPNPNSAGPNGGGFYTYYQDDSGCAMSREIIDGNQPCLNYGGGSPILPAYGNFNTFTQYLANASTVELYLENVSAPNGLSAGANSTTGTIGVQNFGTINLVTTGAIPQQDLFGHPTKYNLFPEMSYAIAAQYPNGTAATLTLIENGVTVTSGSSGGGEINKVDVTIPNLLTSGSLTPIDYADSSNALGTGDLHTPAVTLTPTTGGSIPSGTVVWVRPAYTALSTGPGDCAGCGGLSPSQLSTITYANRGTGYTTATVSIPGCPGAGGQIGANGEVGQSFPPGEVAFIILSTGGVCTSSSPQTIVLTPLPGQGGTGFSATLTPQNLTIAAPAPSQAVTVGAGGAFIVTAPGPDPLGAATGYNVYAGTQSGQELFQVNEPSVSTNVTITSLGADPTANPPVPYPENQNPCGPIDYLIVKGLPQVTTPEFDFQEKNCITGALTTLLADSPNGLVVGNPTGGAEGAGTVNMQGCFINGVPCGGGGGGGIGGSGNAGYYALFAGFTTIGDGHLDDGVTTTSVITSSEKVAAPSMQDTGLAGSGTRGVCADPTGTFTTAACASGGGTITPEPQFTIPVYSAAGTNQTLGASSITDNGTTVATGEAFVAASVKTAILNADNYYVVDAPTSCSVTIQGTTFTSAKQGACAHLNAKLAAITNNRNVNLWWPAGETDVDIELDQPCLLSNAFGVPSVNDIGAGGSATGYGSHIKMVGTGYQHLDYKCPGATSGHAEMGIWWDGNGLVSGATRSLNNVGTGGGSYDVTVSGSGALGYNTSEDEITAQYITTTGYVTTGSQINVTLQAGQVTSLVAGSTVHIISPSLNGGASTALVVLASPAPTVTTFSATTALGAATVTETGLISIGSSSSYQWPMWETTVRANGSNIGLTTGDQVTVAVSTESVASSAWSISGGTVSVTTGTQSPLFATGYALNFTSPTFNSGAATLLWVVSATPTSFTAKTSVTGTSATEAGTAVLQSVPIVTINTLGTNGFGNASNLYPGCPGGHLCSPVVLVGSPSVNLELSGIDPGWYLDDTSSHTIVAVQPGYGFRANTVGYVLDASTTQFGEQNTNYSDSSSYELTSQSVGSPVYIRGTLTNCALSTPIAGQTTLTLSPAVGVFQPGMRVAVNSSTACPGLNSGSYVVVSGTSGSVVLTASPSGAGGAETGAPYVIYAKDGAGLLPAGGRPTYYHYHSVYDHDGVQVFGGNFIDYECDSTANFCMNLYGPVSVYGFRQYWNTGILPYVNAKAVLLGIQFTPSYFIGTSYEQLQTAGQNYIEFQTAAGVDVAGRIDRLGCGVTVLADQPAATAEVPLDVLGTNCTSNTSGIFGNWNGNTGGFITGTTQSATVSTNYSSGFLLFHGSVYIPGGGATFSDWKYQHNIGAGNQQTAVDTMGLTHTLNTATFAYTSGSALFSLGTPNSTALTPVNETLFGTFSMPYPDTAPTTGTTVNSRVFNLGAAHNNAGTVYADTFSLGVVETGSSAAPNLTWNLTCATAAGGAIGTCQAQAPNFNSMGYVSYASEIPNTIYHGSGANAAPTCTSANPGMKVVINDGASSYTYMSAYTPGAGTVIAEVICSDYPTGGSYAYFYH